MNPDSFDEVVGRICDADDRYDPEAYYFVREALDHTITALSRVKDGKPQHVTGKELAMGVRDYALAEFGPLALLALTEWGLHETLDFGEVVYNLIEAGVMGKTPTDSKGDFADVFDFQEAFGRPYAPRHPEAFAKRR
jgi:uncharacterized repeat protein (TIGR04138 family)